jgi:hypothetical protein
VNDDVIHINFDERVLNKELDHGMFETEWSTHEMVLRPPSFKGGFLTVLEVYHELREGRFEVDSS